MAVVKLVATLSSSGRRAVVAGGVADRYASELARAGQSNRRRAGTGSASPERASRLSPWPAGMAECLARVKIAQTSAGPASLTISDPSRFPARFQNTQLMDYRIRYFLRLAPPCFFITCPTKVWAGGIMPKLTFVKDSLATLTTGAPRGFTFTLARNVTSQGTDHATKWSLSLLITTKHAK